MRILLRSGLVVIVSFIFIHLPVEEILAEIPPHYVVPKDCGSNWEPTESRYMGKQRVSGGSDSYWGQFPSYLYVPNMNCSAALVTDQWAITLGDCILYENRTQVNNLIAYGGWVLSGINKWPRYPKDPTDNYFIRACHNVKYPFHLPFANYAVLKLKRPLVGNETNRVIPICLPERPLSDTPDVVVNAVGFGANEMVNGQPVFPKTLQTLRLRYLKEKRKSRMEMRLVPETEGAVCQNDRGDPIIGTENGRQILYGIVLDRNNDCENSKKPIRSLDMFGVKEDLIRVMDDCFIELEEIIPANKISSQLLLTTIHFWDGDEHHSSASNLLVVNY